ncbi:MAG: papain-like cysteine protease family protein [Micropepsaceae bacterium]
MAQTNIVLNAPHALNQNKLGYDQDVGWYACWVAAAEMVKTARTPGARVKRPAFNPARSSDARIELFLKQEEHLRSLNFSPLGSASKVWSPEAICAALREWGPLYAYGLFFLDDNNPIFSPVAPTASNRMNGDQHAICIYGITESFGGVYYIDPWDAARKQMSVASFAQRVHPMNSFGVAGCADNRRS